MASGIIANGIYNNSYRYKINWTSEKDIVKNRSKLILKVYFENDYEIYIGRRTNKLIVDGTSYNIESNIDSLNGSFLLKTITQYVNHNENGKKSISISGYFDVSANIFGTWYNKININQVIKLDDIPRKATIISPKNSTYSINSSIQMSANKKFAEHELRRIFKAGDKVIYDYTTTADSYESDSIRGTALEIAKSSPNSKIARITHELITLYENKVIGKDVSTFYVNIENKYPPLIQNLELIEKNSKVKNMNLGANTFLKDYSQISYTADVSAQANAQISYIPSKNLNLWNRKVFSGTKNLEFRDTRDVTTTKTVNVTILDYFNPKIESFTVARKDELPNRITINARILCANPKNKNPYSLKIYKRVKNYSTFSLIYGTQNLYNEQILNLDEEIRSEAFSNDLSYEFKIVVKDILNETSSITVLSQTAHTMYLGEKGVCVGGKLSDTKMRGLEVFGRAIFNNAILEDIATPIKKNDAVNKDFLDKRITSEDADLYSGSSDGLYFKGIQKNWAKIAVGVSIHTVSSGTRGIAIVYKYPNLKHGFVFSFGYGKVPRLDTRNENGTWTKIWEG